MEFQIIIILLLFSFPLFSSLLNGIDMTLSYRNKITPETDRIKLLLIFFYACTGLNWFLIILLQFNWDLYNYIGSFYFSFNLLWVVFFYHYIFYMTSVEKNERFKTIQYIIPSIFFLFFLIYPFFIPLNICFQNVNEQIIIDPIYSNSSFLIYPLAIFRRVFMMIYGILCFRRIKKFNSLANNESQSKKWLWVIFCIYGIIFLINIFRLFDYSTIWPVILFTAIMAISLVALQTVICFNMLNNNYKLFNLEETKQSDSGKRKYTSFQEVRYKSYHQKKKRVSITIDRSEFENYFRLKKPYLDPNFKIEDLGNTFKACRSIISSYVNKTYDMNFSWYVNRWRLEEMERLMKLRSNNGKDPQELVLKAGFGSYRNYVRVKSYFMNNPISDK